VEASPALPPPANIHPLPVRGRDATAGED